MWSQAAGKPDRAFGMLPGLRWGEMSALRVGSLDLIRRRMRIKTAFVEVKGRLVEGTPKTHQNRTVPLPRFLVDDVAAHVEGKGPDELVFSTPAGAPLRNTNFRRRHWDWAVKEAGLHGLTPHDLRHTAASLAVAAGANVEAVQRMLGHASADHDPGRVRGPLRGRPRHRRGPARRGRAAGGCRLSADQRGPGTGTAVRRWGRHPPRAGVSCEPERRIELLTYALRAWSMANERTITDRSAVLASRVEPGRTAPTSGGRAMDA